MPNIQMLNPDSLGKPLGAYSNIARVKASEFLFVAGQVGSAAHRGWVGDVELDGFDT